MRSAATRRGGRAASTNTAAEGTSCHTADGVLNSHSQGQFWEKTIEGLHACKLNDVGPPEDPKLGNQRAVEILTSRFDQASQIVVGNTNFNTSTYSGRVRNEIANVLASRLGSAGCLDKLFTVRVRPEEG